MKQKISRDVPLAELTLRRYEKPCVMGRELVRKFCLSLGLLQPGDSRDIVVDILLVLLKAKQKKEELHSEEIKNRVIKLRHQAKLPLLGIAGSNIRRQLKRLKSLYLIENRANLYRITEFASLEEIFKEKIQGFLLNSILRRIQEYLKEVEKSF